MRIRERKHRLPPETYRGCVKVAYTACINGRREPFRDLFITTQFQKSLMDAAANHASSVLVSCFMPDHLHVILEGQSGEADTWKAMTLFKQKTGFWFARHRHDFQWQKDFHDHVICDEKTLDDEVQYILGNPVRKGIVDAWQKYPGTYAAWVAVPRAG